MSYLTNALFPKITQTDQYPIGMEDYIKKYGYFPMTASRLIKNLISKLSPKDYFRYLAWLKLRRQKGLPDTQLNDPMSFYDQSNFFKNRIEGTLQEMNPTLGHAPDLYKLPGHPTFSNESQYAFPNVLPFQQQIGIPSLFDSQNLVPTGTWKGDYYHLFPPTFDSDVPIRRS